MTNLPRAILFDLDDTILSAYGQPELAWKTVVGEFSDQLENFDTDDLVREIGIYAREFWSDASQHKHWRLRLTEARRRIVAGGFERLSAKSGARPDDTIIHALADRFSAFREEEMKFFPGACETLDKLKELGVIMALITNGAAETQRAKVVRFGLEHRFDHIQIEGEHGFGKPEEQAYRHALSVLDVAPEETWMVGDNLEWEIAAPQRLGICGIWHDPHRMGLPASSEVKPDRIIHALPELLPDDIRKTI
ncbi:HAD family hydrolase [Parvibaculum sp.]|jgi:putative hydrolase of the HAD superfamily|uniref:HAD family hydrolase n=1 Tax=Parvibaculum sp. TaxID=2024848 RepID=UPI001B1575A5|nr:HAD family hydrolase [Parvibaculum sp.]MBO6633026.1 HAD family hydrolase [Parvibaculum sp.]MBO6679367.1 HAD family hydrolase [Parvibaculum sp.]MBO6684609.1 HAD family hydrolase [Parvibaculum sp.]MBO6904521.1 HAD family hydrolase [Parvibaculum sp.]